MKYFYFLAMLGCALGLSSCNKAVLQDEQDVSCLVENRICQEVKWKGDSHCQSQDLQWVIHEWLSQDLTVDRAVQIALLNHPKIQILFEELGIAQADLLEAGLLSNPIFEGLIRFPHQRRTYVNTEFSVAFSFLDIFLIPLRQKIAGSAFEQTKYQVAHEILSIAFDVQEAFYRLQGEEEHIQLLQSLLAINQLIQDVSQRQYAAGNINIRDEQQQQIQVLKLEIELDKSHIEQRRLREQLNAWLGFSAQGCWKIHPQLPHAEEQILNGEDLEAIALEQRLDIKAAQWEICRLAQMLGIKQWWTYTEPQLGISTERDSDGIRVTGPTFSTALPIFNTGQADRWRLYAQLRQAKERLAALKIQVVAEVREACRVLEGYQDVLTNYQSRLLPTANQLFESTHALYNAMGIGLPQLLESKYQQMQIMLAYRMSLKDYWLARINLDRALDGYLESARCHGLANGFEDQRIEE